MARWFAENHPLISTPVRFGRVSSQGEEPDDLSGRKDLSPEDILEELSPVVAKLRKDFFLEQQELADGILNPRQKALVEAIREKGWQILRASGWDSHQLGRRYYDNFLLVGELDEQGSVLQKLHLFFTPARDDGKTAWKEAKVLDGLALEWEGNRGVEQGKTRFFSTIHVDPNNPNYLWRRGEIRVKRDDFSLSTDGLPIELDELSRDRDWIKNRPQPSNVIYRLFVRWLHSKVGKPVDARQTIVLARSSPLFP